MSFVDALHDRDHDRILVVERVNGERVYNEFPAEYVFYHPDRRGKFTTIFGNSVSRFSTRNYKEFQKELKMHSGQELFESDFKPVFRCLENNYKGKDSPKLQTAFFDIEVDFHQERGFSPPEDPFNAITAITVYLDWLEQCITLAVPPKTMSMDQARHQVQEFDNTFLFEKEHEMLLAFLDVIQDADILSGWNSEGFDIPYTINRITRILSKDDTRRFCLWGQLPKKRTFERYGAAHETYDTVGRIHMDYLQLYRKYTYHEMHSYSLDAIAEYELGERKVQYEGTLDQLYNQDFRKFIDYNRQDTMILGRLDEKLKFLDLANELAHANTVLLQTTMGAVAVTEQAIINEAHERGLIVPDRKKHERDDTQAAGAYVAVPKTGIHQWVGSVDINSLYPSVIRALNMAPETIVGQLRPIMTDQFIKERMAKKMSFAASWEGLFGTIEYTAVMDQRADTEITVDWVNGESTVHSAHEIWHHVFNSNSNLCLSANGTIFTYEREGVVPGLLKRWYAERKELQAKKKEATTKEDIAFWDKRQLVKKINLNSLYGAILNPGCRFFDKRIGQSTTLTGRAIAQHMDAFINQVLTGEYDHVGECVVYGDTDSCYFSAWPVMKGRVERGEMEWNKDIAVQLYDAIGDEVNNSFPPFAYRAFHCPEEYGNILACGREVVAESGLFITKKRYALLVIDNEGQRLDIDGKPGKVKAMGLDLKRSDTPKIVQDFLSDILQRVLKGASRDDVVKHIREFKIDFHAKPAWEKGTPKRVNNLTKYGELERQNQSFHSQKAKVTIPGHVRAALNWNYLRKMHNDNYSMAVVDGMKTVVCKLKSNPLGLNSIGYPTDESRLPEWFKELPFDDALMESTIIDQKVDNLLGVLEWDLLSSTDTSNTFEDLFEFV